MNSLSTLDVKQHEEKSNLQSRCDFRMLVELREFHRNGAIRYYLHKQTIHRKKQFAKQMRFSSKKNYKIRVFLEG